MEARDAGRYGPTDQWLALVAAVERLSAAEDIQTIIHIVRDTAREVSGADGVTFVLRDDDQCHYVDENAIGPLWKGRRFPLSACISGWCMLNRQTAVVPDIYADPRIPHDAYRPTFVKSLIMAPVRPNAPLGAIGSYWASRREFTPSDLALVEGLARATTAAVDAIQARAQTRQSEARLHLALEAGRLGAWELDVSSLRLSASPRCREILGWPLDVELDQTDLIHAIHPDDVGRGQRHFNDARAGRAPFQIEVRVAATETRWIELRGAAVRDAEARITRIAGVVCDITDATLARERIEELQSSLWHAGRLGELGRMSAAIVHELNQPLTAASNYLSALDVLALRADAPLEQVRGLGQKAAAQVDRAGKILRQIRGVATRSETTPVSEELGALLGEAVELARLDPRHRDVDLRLTTPDEVCRALVDRTQIVQVSLNLIRNAFDAVEGRPERRVEVVVAAEVADEVVVRVADSGPGLDPEVLAQLFQPFTTTKSEGMGLGLSISRDIVEAHGGRIWVESGEAGATFSFALPRDQGVA